MKNSLFGCQVTRHWVEYALQVPKKKKANAQENILRGDTLEQ
jgi:hypothetical protein